MHFLAVIRWGTRTASAGLPLTGGEFSLNLSGDSPPLRRERAAPRGGGKRVDTKVFYPLNSHFLLFLSLAQTGDRRPLRNKGTAVGLPQRVFREIFAVHDSVLLHRLESLRRRGIAVPRNS